MLLYYGTGYGYYYFDWTYLLVIVAAIFSMIASYRVNSVFNKYAKVRSMSGMTGAEVASRILQYYNITDVQIAHTSGTLTDHYNPRTKVVNLSDSTYNSTSVAAISVAAHECGHVVQHHENYTPIRIRSAIVPAANIGSKLGIPIVILGIILSYNWILIQIGIWVFSLSVLFQMVTLPVEFDASARALRFLSSSGYLQGDEVPKGRKVLSAAAMTYVAAAASSVLQLLRLIMMANRRRD